MKIKRKIYGSNSFVSGGRKTSTTQSKHVALCESSLLHPSPNPISTTKVLNAKPVSLHWPPQHAHTGEAKQPSAPLKQSTYQLSGPVRDTPPYLAIPFRDSIAEGGIAPICLVFIGYRASIAEIPLFRGGIAPPLRMLSEGEMLRKGGGIAPLQLAMLRQQKPHSAQ